MGRLEEVDTDRPRKRTDHKTEGELMGYQEVDIAVSQIENAYQEAKCILLPKNQAINVDTPFGSVELCMMVLNETAVTASIVPGSSGGMMVNDAGQLIGVASCTDSHFGYFVTLNDIKAFLSGY